QGADVAELTGLLDLEEWPEGMRAIVRCERPRPGAQRRLEDVDGYRLTTFATNTARGQLGILLCSSSRADGWLGRVEDPIDLAGEVALQAAADLLGGAALGSSSLDVGPGFRVMCHAGADGDVQSPVQTSAAAAVAAVADVAPRRRRDRTPAGQSGKRGLGTHSAVMGPCGEADGSGHGCGAVLLEQWRGLARLGECSHPCAVGGHLFVEP